MGVGLKTLGGQREFNEEELSHLAADGEEIRDQKSRPTNGTAFFVGPNSTQSSFFIHLFYARNFAARSVSTPLMIRPRQCVTSFSLRTWLRLW